MSAEVSKKKKKKKNVCEHVFSDRCLMSEILALQHKIDVEQFSALTFCWTHQRRSCLCVVGKLASSSAGSKEKQQRLEDAQYVFLTVQPFGISMRKTFYSSYVAFYLKCFCAKFALLDTFLGPAPKDVHLPLISSVFQEVQGSLKY